MSDQLQAKIDALMLRVKAGDLGQLPEVIRLFNSRPLRRHDDVRIQGWSVVLPE